MSSETALLARIFENFPLPPEKQGLLELIILILKKGYLSPEQEEIIRAIIEGTAPVQQEIMTTLGKRISSGKLQQILTILNSE